MARVRLRDVARHAVIQLADQRAEGRLRQVAALRGAGEVPFVGQEMCIRDSISIPRHTSG